MKKILLVLAMVIAIATYAQEREHKSCSGAGCCTQCDSINMPYILSMEWKSRR